ncbi:MAG: hypothetical protein FD143_1376 [Ignavibacteria bacterium]|nr:MAG: hypothetical protein FD143_1376 [Ignavibacteria bacterium]KAF0161762.1 MAG: hypothetical protein FD188_567 [Ignavibacteria bacterium]
MKVLKTTEKNSGVYLLEIQVREPIQIKAKKFLNHKFPKGFYYYSGSAQKNLQQRIERHLRKEKIIHWHVDHLTANPSAEIKTVFIANEANKILECEMIKTLQINFEMEIAVEGFGNGDCINCNSHLFYSKKKIDYNHLISLYQSIVRFIPSSK